MIAFLVGALVIAVVGGGLYGLGWVFCWVVDALEDLDRPPLVLVAIPVALVLSILVLVCYGIGLAVFGLAERLGPR